MNQLVSMDGKKNHHENRCTMHTSVFSLNIVISTSWKGPFTLFCPVSLAVLIFFGDENVWKPETHIKMWALIRLLVAIKKLCVEFFFSLSGTVALDLYKHFGILRIWNLTILTKKMICKLKLGDIHIPWYSPPVHPGFLYIGGWNPTQLYFGFHKPL